MFVVPCKLCGNMPTLRMAPQGDCEGLYVTFIVECRNHPDFVVGSRVRGPYTNETPSRAPDTDDQAHAAAWHAWNNAHDTHRWFYGRKVCDRLTQGWLMQEDETPWWNTALDKRRRPNH